MKSLIDKFEWIEWPQKFIWCYSRRCFA